MKTTYHIARMDCSAEEQMIRMRLGDLDGIEHLAFDLDARTLVVHHRTDPERIGAALRALRLGAEQVGHEEANSGSAPSGAVEGDERRPLQIALAINAAFFVGEVVAGVLAGSMGLVADALDMLADASVYALSLAAVGHAGHRKKRLARYSGYLQMGLAIVGLVEVVRRFVSEAGVPDVPTMVAVAALALAGNVATLLVLRRARRGEAHVEASWIFTSNDIKVNGLVILSALLVALTASRVPDLLAGAFIFLIVARGARQILALSAPAA